MVIIVSSAIIQKQKLFLFVKEIKPSAAGKWGLPGGKVEEGESISDGIRREVLEETGYTVYSEKLSRIVNKTRTHEGNTVIKFVFECQIHDVKSSGAEHQCKYFSIDDVRKLQDEDLIRGDEILGILQDIADGNKYEPFLQIIH